MFQRRRQNSLRRALQRASDPEVRRLEQEVADRQEEVARLELEIFDTQVDLSRFEREFEVRVGHLQRRLDDLEARLSEARHRAARRAQWGDRIESDEPPVDVIEQFQRTWSRPEEPAEPPPPPKKDEATQAQLKRLYRTLAKRFHPDLVTDAAQKKWREEMMAQVNAAYAAGDLSALQKLAEKEQRLGAEPVKTREQIMADLAAEVRRLDALIIKLRSGLQGIINSQLVKLMLDASIARRSGRDLLGELAADLKVEISRVEAELAALGAQG